MEVAVTVTVNVELMGDEELPDRDALLIARAAAEIAFEQNGAFTKNGIDVVEAVTVHVDGYGKVKVAQP